jgi:hypothetical protein
MSLTQALVGDGPFTLQLNAYNPASATSPATSWMQYVSRVAGAGIQTQVQYWNMGGFNACSAATSGPCKQNETFNARGQMTLSAPLPSNTLPAGYTLQIALDPDAAGNVASATFMVTDALGNTSTQTLAVDAHFRFPIVAFELVLVGPDNSLPVAFSAGDGVFFYKMANGQLCLEGGLPEQCILRAGEPGGQHHDGREFQCGVRRRRARSRGRRPLDVRGDLLRIVSGAVRHHSLNRFLSAQRAIAALPLV